MNGPGMWMPKQKDGKNWKVDFTLTLLNPSETVTRTKTFRIRANAYDWINDIKSWTVEAGEKHTPLYSDFTYKVSKLNQENETIKIDGFF